VHGLMNPEAISNIPITIEQIHRLLSRVLLEGILSDSGREEYKQLKLKRHNNGDPTT